MLTRRHPSKPHTYKLQINVYDVRVNSELYLQTLYHLLVYRKSNLMPIR